MSDIKEIISQAGLDSINKATSALEKSYLAIQDNIKGAKELNDVLVKSGTMGQLTKNTEAQAIAQEKLRQATLKTQELELKIEAQKQSIFAKEQAREAKRQADEAKALAADEKRIKAIEATAKKEQDAINKSIEASNRRAQAIEANAIKELEANAKVLREKQRKESVQFASSGNSNANTSPNAQLDRAEEDRLSNEATAIGKVTQETEKNTKARKQNNIEREKANQLAKIDRVNLVAQAREENAVKGSLEQRRLALIRLRNIYDNLSASEREDRYGQRLQSIIEGLNDQVLNLERSTGRSQRNVGNYFQQAWGGLRNIANILPGVGIAGIIAFATEPIIEYITQLDIFKKKAIEVVGETAASSSEFKKSISDINALKTSISEFQTGIISRKELVDRFNESLGKTVGELKTATEVESFYNSKAGTFIEAMLLRAKATAALEEATEKASEAQKRASGGSSFADNFAGFFANIPEIIGGAIEDFRSTVSNPFDGFTNTRGLANSFKLVTDFAKKAQGQAVKDLEKEAKTGFALFDQLQKEADKFAKKNGFNFRPTTTNTDDALRKAAEARIQIQIDENKRVADIYKEQFENQNFSQEARLNSLNNFNQTSNEIAKLELKKEKLNKKISKDELLKAESDYSNKLLDITKNSANQVLVIAKQTAEEQERIRVIRNENAISDIEKERDLEISALVTAFQKRGDFTKKSQEDLEKERLEIVRKYNLMEVNEAIRQAQTLIDIRKSQGADVTKEQANLTALILKAKDLEVQGAVKASAEELDKRKQNADAIREVAQELYNFTRGLTNGIFEANIANLEEESKIREEKKNRDIEDVNESTLSEEQKAERIAVINAQAEQAQLAIDARIREQKRKQAIADKAFALGQIVINTAVAVSKALAQTGVLGSFVIPGIIALGAIQTAAVLAQPIPKFAKGGTMQKDGLAEYGHGREIRIDPDGMASLTSSTPEIGFVKAGTKFISAPETKRLLAKPNGNDVAGKSWDLNVTALISESQRSSKETKKAISKISINTMTLTERGLEKTRQRAIKINSYINKNFG